MTAYYNEIDPAAAHILECLIRDGVIADGIVDRRSIVDIEPGELRDFRQCHFFAGGGLWSVALRMAGVPDSAEVWTGSCPCQPLSVAGKQKGADDERHLWPAFHRLISERRPAIVFGEQVAGKLGLEWFAGVRADLEESGYACGGADLPACGVGAPHIRKRLFWCAMGNANALRELQSQGGVSHKRGWIGDTSRNDVGDANSLGLQGGSDKFMDSQGREDAQRPSRLPDGASFWADYEWRLGSDGKARRVKPGIRLLVDGLPGRVHLLRLGGNAIVPQVASVFVKSAIEALDA